jgi:16S rRNA (guanine527-N7)-methyltransferase
MSAPGTFYPILALKLTRNSINALLETDKAEMDQPVLDKFTDALQSHEAAYGVSLSEPALSSLSKYYEMLNVWNSRIHLVAPCTPQEFATRHILESLILLKHLPKEASVVEVGAGAGLPILPCLIVRPDLRAVLIEA